MTFCYFDIRLLNWCEVVFYDFDLHFHNDWWYYLFMYSLAICITSLWKYLFKFFVHFQISLLFGCWVLSIFSTVWIFIPWTLKWFILSITYCIFLIDFNIVYVLGGELREYGFFFPNVFILWCDWPVNHCTYLKCTIWLIICQPIVTIEHTHYLKKFLPAPL